MGGSNLENDILKNTIKVKGVNQEITDDLNDSLINLLDQMVNTATYEELEELRDFCNQLTKWSDFTEARLLT